MWIATGLVDVLKKEFERSTRDRFTFRFWSLLCEREVEHREAIGGRAIRRNLIRFCVVGDLDFEGIALDARETSEEAVEEGELELLRGRVGGRSTPKLAFLEKAPLDLKPRLFDFLTADHGVLALLCGVDERPCDGLDCE